KLDAFREKVKKGRLVYFWNKADELPGKVAVSMMATIKRYPAEGWVRASNLDNTTQLLSQLNEVRKHNEQLRIELEKMKAELSGPEIPELASMEDTFLIEGIYSNSLLKKDFPWSVELSWEEIFKNVGPELLNRPIQHLVWNKLNSLCIKRTGLKGRPPLLS